VAFEGHGTNQSDLIHAQRMPILSAHCLEEKPRRRAHFPHVSEQTPPATRLASTTRGLTDSPMCHTPRRQSRESWDEPPRGSVRRGARPGRVRGQRLRQRRGHCRPISVQAAAAQRSFRQAPGRCRARAWAAYRQPITKVAGFWWSNLASLLAREEAGGPPSREPSKEAVAIQGGMLLPASPACRPAAISRPIA
jgi:hypothetical protein